MPLDKATFRERTITAIVFAIVMLAGLLINEWSFIILFVIIHFGCWYEYVKLMKKIINFKTLIYYATGLLYITLPFLLLICLRLIWPVSTPVKLLAVIPCGIIF